MDARRTALVTGASSGIGRAMAELLAVEGYNVVLVARRRDRLEDIARSVRDRCDVEMRPLAADLSDPATPARIARELASSSTGIDLLVNNAGYSSPGEYHSRSWAEHDRRLRVMGTASLELTHRLLPGMLERRWGRIINVASLAALFTGTPHDVIYGATKALVVKFSQGIDSELRHLGIRCTVSLPGLTDTEIFEASGFADNVDRHRIYRLAMMAPETVAREAYAAVMKGRPVVVHGRHHRAVAVALLHAPPPVRRALSNAMSAATRQRRDPRASESSTSARTALRSASATRSSSASTAFGCSESLNTS